MKAVAKYVRISPRKARLVADQVRGKSYPEALSILQFTNKKAARIIDEVLRSAGANAENNHATDPDELVVREIRVDEGPTLKRYRARALGRATMIRKRTSHITVVLGEPAAVAVGTPGSEEEG
ncbi:MAG: 50S ribosomal protein L22 [Rubrobacteraceae bacterium]|uniref:50S ribosomal protein L22 n=1 Tax=Rubrobacter naiadicus TaxID=1392641 RepID=UPI00235F37D1|nr:50S ribosomal protein L22 [Rubrobacter naiadicus]MBX6763958.1 50S ribosomal protein L22 [Rubrobacteraceae bacterium]MCL6439388.1 50S ribosomal protein L22 [Rubrobacteraceae bacterium]